MAGFADDPKKKKADGEQITSYTFKDAIIGDAVVMLPKVMAQLGFKFKETTFTRKSPMGDQVMPFVHTTLKGGLDIPYGCYEVEGLGTLRPGMGDIEADIVPELQLSVSWLDKEGLGGRDMWADLIKALEAALANGRTSSMFYGKAIRVERPKDLLIPRYIDVAESVNVYMNPEVAEAIDDHVFFPIREHAELVKAGIRTQRGVLLHGKYGVGKSLIAYRAAQEALKSDRTFVLCSMDMFCEALKIARYLQPSVLFVEDMDNVQRTRQLSDLRNLMSGVDSKRGYDVISILTTNFLDKVIATDRSLLRPERIDAVIEVTPPNAGVVHAMLHDIGGRGVLNPDDDWATMAVSIARSGNVTPALLLEMLTRAKIKALKLKRPLNYNEFSAIAENMKMQVGLSQPEQPKAIDRPGRFARDLEAIIHGDFDSPDANYN